MSTLDLTERQIEVCALIAGGCSRERVAKELGVSPRVVRFHMERASERLLPFVPHLRGHSARRIIQGYYVEYAGVIAFHLRREQKAA